MEMRGCHLLCVEELLDSFQGLGIVQDEAGCYTEIYYGVRPSILRLLNKLDHYGLVLGCFLPCINLRHACAQTTAV